MKLGDVCCHLIPRYLNCTNWSSDFEKFEDFLLNLNSPMFLILGDLNARMANPQLLDENLLLDIPLINTERKSKDKCFDSKGKKILNLLESVGGVILNGRHQSDPYGEYTFCGGAGSSVIDYCISSLNLLKLITDFSIPCKAFSDHMPLVVNITIKTASTALLRDLSLPQKLYWKPNNSNKYVNALKTASNTEYIWSNSDIDDKITVLLGKIKDASGSKVSKRFFEPKNKWFDYQCATARAKMLCQLDLFRQFSLESYKREYVKSKTRYSKLCNNKKLSYLNENINKLNYVRNSSDWWKLANSFKESTHIVGNSLTSDDFRSHFQTLLSAESSLHLVSWCMPSFIDPFLDSPFESSDLFLVLKQSKLNKAPGIDRISYEFYKNAPRCFLEEVLQIFNRIFLRSEIPSSFRKSITVPLFKKGNHNCVSNYRGLSLLDTCYKLFTGLILNRIHVWINLNNIINEYQAGFRKEYSTVDNLFNLSSIVHLNFKAKKKTFAFFVDFSCAFDSIPRNSLFYKLSELGLSSKIIKILQLLYNKTTSQVWDGESLSEPFSVSQGVKQGCLLSPVLFSLYLNDLHDLLPGGVEVAGTTVKLLMYADDIVLLSTSPDVLQKMIDALYSYCKKWGLKVNLAKSKILIFREGPRFSKLLGWTLGEEKIEIVNEYKYLGVILTYNLSLLKHLDLKLATAKNAINATWISYINNPKISILNKLKIFNAAARSIMFYSVQIWGFKQYDQVEKLFRFFIKKLLFLPRNTPNYMLHLETGLKTQFVETLRLHFNYINKVFNLPSNRLPKILAEETILKNVYWVAEWRNLHTELGINMPSRNTFNSPSEHFNDVLKCLEASQHQSHLESAKNSQNHDLYPALQHEKVQYFSNQKDAYLVGLVFKARGGLLNLNARAFRSVPVGPCSICNTNLTEDTYHLIGVCPIYKNTRLKNFGKKELSVQEVKDILNGNNFIFLYEFLVRSLHYRTLLLNEFN